MRENVVQSGPNVPVLPAELRENRPGFQGEELPEGNDIVLARVDLGYCPVAEAVDSARHIIDAVVGAAVPYAGSWAWRMLEGYVHFAGDLSTSVHFFERPEEDPPSNYALNALAEVLTSRLGRIRPESIRASGQLRQLLDGMSRWREAQRTSLLERLIFDVRNIGLVASHLRRGRLSWNGFVDRYMAHAWVAAEISRYLDESVRWSLYHTIWGLGGPKHPSAADRERWAQLVDAMPGGGHRLKLDRALPLLDSVIAEYDRRDSRYAALLGVRDRLRDQGEARRWVASVRRQFSLRVSRLRRERNVIGHGGPVHMPSVNTVAGLSQELAFLALERAMGGLLQGRTVEQGLGRLSQDAQSWLSELEAGRMPGYAEWTLR